MKEELLKRFTSYVKIDTQSNELNETCPSSEGQWTLAKQLVTELEEIGLVDITLDQYGYVMATLPANTDKEIPTIGFLAHLDTATDFTGKNVQPNVHHNYTGADIPLNESGSIVLSKKDFPNLTNYIGHTLITTDGSTLLGADNKAGIAEIMTAVHYLKQHPEIEHGTIRVAFTPDEEIGRGPHKFDVDAFRANYAYTVDGGPLGELQYESFSAAAAVVTVNGTNIHPGTAKGKMVNSMKIAMELQDRLPKEQAPEHTEGYEGFFHLLSFEGDVEKTTLHYIIRDFDTNEFEAKKALMTTIVKELQAKYGAERLSLELTDQYYNMRAKIEPEKHIVDIAHKAMTNLGVTPIVEPIRGGTDGSQLSYMGLPTPNIFTGGENFHGKYEFISLENMESAAKVIVEIARLFAERTE